MPRHVCFLWRIFGVSPYVGLTIFIGNAVVPVTWVSLTAKCRPVVMPEPLTAQPRSLPSSPRSHPMEISSYQLVTGPGISRGLSLPILVLHFASLCSWLQWGVSHVNSMTHRIRHVLPIPAVT